MRCQAARIILDYTCIYFKYDLIVLGDDGCVWSSFIEAALGACACLNRVAEPPNGTTPGPGRHLKNLKLIKDDDDDADDLSCRGRHWRQLFNINTAVFLNRVFRTQ